MTLARFVSKNAFRNKRRSILTVLSIAFSLLLLTLMMTLWRSFYMDDGSAESAERLVVRHKVSLTFSLPGYYREKIRSIPGVTAVVPVSWFGGLYKDDKPENFFAQFGTDPEEFFKVYRDIQIPDDQVVAWFNTQGTPRTAEEITAWSSGVEGYRPYDNPEKKDWFVGECAKLGIKPEASTLVDCLEADDIASFKI